MHGFFLSTGNDDGIVLIIILFLSKSSRLLGLQDSHELSKDMERKSLTFFLYIRNIDVVPIVNYN